MHSSTGNPSKNYHKMSQSNLLSSQNMIPILTIPYYPPCHTPPKKKNTKNPPSLPSPPPWPSALSPLHSPRDTQTLSFTQAQQSIETTRFRLSDSIFHAENPHQTKKWRSIFWLKGKVFLVEVDGRGCLFGGVVCFFVSLNGCFCWFLLIITYPLDIQSHLVRYSILDPKNI